MNVKKEVYRDPKYLDPTYGSGCFRRHIRISAVVSGEVRGALEDDCHAFEVCLRHDGHQVTDVQARWLRYPTTTCPGSLEVVTSMVGCPLSDDLLVIKRYTSAATQCTHLHDMMCLLVVHAYLSLSGDETVTEYQVAVSDPDPQTQQQRLILKVNQDVVFDWLIRDWRLVTPQAFAGLPIMKGFMGWVTKRLPEQLVHAFILQMGYFVSTSRRLNFPLMVGMQVQDAGHPINACYASLPERAVDSFKVDHKRNFKDCPEQLLRFVDF
ncbi:MAG: hypothetical protein AseanaTS_05460 [Candidatus Pelagadaptatus aseana]|uniref:DUF2889 domain-containing protein n=1 Tax=Candidatus Pelagadaptatus aseana TaxID=3120508 RepID=UPI0039B32045